MSKKISRALSRTIGTGSVACLSDTPTLSREDVADLKKLLRKKQRDPEVNTKQAIAVLARVEPTAASAKILADILASSREPARLRVSAAAGLGAVARAEAEQALLDALETPDPVVRIEVIKSLGKVGTQDSLRRLAKLPKTTSDHELQLAEFASSLIALRTGDVDAARVPGLRWRGQKLATVEGDAVKDRIGRLWGSTYGLRLNSDVAFTMKCGKAQLSLLLNRELKRGAWLDSVRERPLLAGVIVARESGHEHHAVRNLVMTTPTRSGFAVSVVRTAGDVVFSGEAKPDREGYWLAVRDVGRERFSTRVEGLITSESVDLKLQTWLGMPRRKNHGHAISTER